MAKLKIKYKCEKCEEVFTKWSGQCSNCKEWNTLSEYNDTITSKIISSSKITAKTMKEITLTSTKRVLTGIDEFDRVVGGGLVDDSITIITAPPGAGKSTLSLMICDKFLSLGKKVLYASGEESSSQIKQRAIRLKLSHIDDMYILDTTCLNDVLSIIESSDIDFVVVDSIQTFTLNEYLPSRAGNPTQVIECASALQEVAKRGNKERMVLIVGQMNKEDELVGTRALEHLVDTILYLEGNKEESFRMLSTNKNRFGNTDEVGFFEMKETGLESVSNASEFFITERKTSLPGVSLTVLKEGSRPIIIEIEGLVSKSFTPYPSRISECLGKEQLNVLISILEQHCKMNFFDKNVVIKTQNNLKIKKSDTNLATIMTIASSYYKQSLPEKTVFIADVGLTGELKKIQNLESRIKELDRMGYKDLYIAPNPNLLKSLTSLSINIHECETVQQVLNKVLKK